LIAATEAGATSANDTAAQSRTKSTELDADRKAATQAISVLRSKVLSCNGRRSNYTTCCQPPCVTNRSPSTPPFVIDCNPN
jgi:hypothetical protein